MPRLASLLSFALLLTLGTTLMAADAVDLKVGNPAPTFSAKTDTGDVWKSGDHVGNGKTVVVFFYPAAMTGGCTKQACAFRDDLGTLAKSDAIVIGVSGDNVENLKLFKQAHKLNFPLLADPTGEVAKAFGVPFTKGEKSIEREIDGETYTLTRGGTAKRWTFVIDGAGKIAAVDKKVNAAGDSQAVLKLLSGK